MIDLTIRNGCSLAALLIAPVSPVLAQSTAPAAAAPQTATPDQPSPGADALQDIVVTAQKRSESAQAIPISMTAVSGATLRESGVNVDTHRIGSNTQLVGRDVPAAYGGGALDDSEASFTSRIQDGESQHRIRSHIAYRLKFDDDFDFNKDPYTDFLRTVLTRPPTAPPHCGDGDPCLHRNQGRRGTGIAAEGENGMTRFFGRQARIALGASVCLAGTPAWGDEGMWTFDNFPAAKVKAAYGVDITPAWLDHVRGAAVRLSTGCSASTVSGRGLVLTNNHCVAECAQDLSSKGQDFYTHGYLTAGAAEEKTCPGMQAEILTAITDVTDQVTGAGQGLTGDALVKARVATTSTIEQQSCADRATTRCQVVSLYHGGQYKLYRYRKYSDVRLVFSPGVQTAFFGGDPDNFNFPRYDLDSAFVRLYENGRPVASPGHLVWNATNPVAGQPVFVAGNPGGTDRQLTVAQLESQRNGTLPARLVQFAELRGRLIRFGEESEENRRVAQDLLFGLENSYKVYVGQLQALSDPAFLNGKRADEAALKARVAGMKAQLPADFGDPWAQLAAIQVKQAELALPLAYVEGGPAGSSLFGYARRLVRAAMEREKPSAQRLPGYADAQLPLLQKQLFDPKPVEAKLEQVVIEFWLSKARENMTADSPETKLLLGRDSPEDLSVALAKSSLGDAAVRRKLWDGGLAAITASRDPMIQLALRIDPEARRLRAAANEQVSGPATIASEKIAKARFAAYGTSTYPDATFTLRLSYGKIDGWSYRGQTIPPFTYFPGLYERATGKAPFDLDPRWVAAQGKLDATTVFDISSTNDIIGGNSGSPLINAKGEVIGAVFDGNIHSLGGNYGYDPVLNRAVSVSAAAVSEALRKVYRANALADELARGS